MTDGPPFRGLREMLDTEPFPVAEYEASCRYYYPEFHQPSGRGETLKPRRTRRAQPSGAAKPTDGGSSRWR